MKKKKIVDNVEVETEVADDDCGDCGLAAEAAQAEVIVTQANKEPEKYKEVEVIEINPLALVTVRVSPGVNIQERGFHAQGTTFICTYKRALQFGKSVEILGAVDKVER